MSLLGSSRGCALRAWVALFVPAGFCVVPACGVEATPLDPLHAERSATGRYRATPLRGLQDHAPYFHDGSAASLAEVVEHYDTLLELGLGDEDSAGLVQYLRSL